MSHVTIVMDMLNIKTVNTSSFNTHNMTYLRKGILL